MDEQRHPSRIGRGSRRRLEILPDRGTLASSPGPCAGFVRGVGEPRHRCQWRACRRIETLARSGNPPPSPPVRAAGCLHEFVVERAMQAGYDFGDECEYGLDLILDALEAHTATETTLCRSSQFRIARLVAFGISSMIQ